MITALLIIAIGFLAGGATAATIIRWAGRQSDLPWATALRVGKVLSDGMDRVERMRPWGADRYRTIMPMPDGSCWSVTVVRHESEADAKLSLGFIESFEATVYKTRG